MVCTLCKDIYRINIYICIHNYIHIYIKINDKYINKNIKNIIQGKKEESERKIFFYFIFLNSSITFSHCENKLINISGIFEYINDD